ncbi:MAG: WG repeat-containing protein [Bacteroidota bacterium]
MIFPYVTVMGLWLITGAYEPMPAPKPSPIPAESITEMLIPFRQAERWGYADIYGEVVIHPNFSRTDFFHGPFACAANLDQCGLIDRKGQVVVPFRFAKADPVPPSFSFPRSNALITEYLFKWADSDTSNYWFLGFDTRWYELDFKEFPELPKLPRRKQYDRREIFRYQGKVGFVAENAFRTHRIEPDRYSEIRIGRLSEYLIVQENGLWGIVNYDGEELLPVQYHWIDEPENPLEGCKIYFFDQVGAFHPISHQYIRPKYKQLEAFNPQGFAKAFVDEDYWGYVGWNGIEYFTKEETDLIGTIDADH